MLAKNSALATGAPSGRQLHLDSLRGIAAVCVILAHYLGAFYPYSIFGETENYSERLAVEGWFHLPLVGSLVSGRFAVNFFFVLSGYVLAWGGLGRSFRLPWLAAKLASRPIRLGGVVLFTVLVSYLLMLFGAYANRDVAAISGSDPWFRGFWNTTPSFAAFVKDLGLLFHTGPKYNSPLWTIERELIGSILIYLLVAVTGGLRWRVWIYLGLVVLAWGNFRYLTPFFPFLAGCLLADLNKHHSRFRRWVRKPILSWGFLLVALFLGSIPYYMDEVAIAKSCWFWLPGMDLLGLELSVLAAVFMMLWAISREDFPLLTSKVGLFLGRISYSIYAIHFIILGAVATHLFLLIEPRLGYEGAFCLVFVICLAITFVASFATTRWVDEPSTQIAKSFSQWVDSCVAAVERKLGLGNRNG